MPLLLFPLFSKMYKIEGCQCGKVCTVKVILYWLQGERVVLSTPGVLGLELSKTAGKSSPSTFGSLSSVVIGRDKYTTQIQLCTTSEKNLLFFPCYRTFALGQLKNVVHIQTLGLAGTDRLGFVGSDGT